MTPYAILSSSLDNHTATDLGDRLAAWHDAMVAHERRLRSGGTRDACDDDCPHAEARLLWPEVLAALGARAHALVFLRSHGAAAPSPRGRARSGGEEPAPIQ